MRWRAFGLKTRFGFDDPADTGIAWGLFSASFPLAGPFYSACTIEPDFDKPQLQFHLQGQVEVIPLRLAFALMAFLATPATIRAFIAFIRARK